MKKTVKIFVKPETKITINKGKLNLFDAPRSFADAIDAFANGRCKEAKIADECKKMIKTRQELIVEKETSIKNKINFAETSIYHNASELEKEITKIKEEIKALYIEIENIDNRKSELIADIRARRFEPSKIDVNVWCAYVEYQNGTLSMRDYKQGIAMWFESYGVMPYEDTIKEVISKLGIRATTNSELIKSNGENFVTTLTEKPFITLFYNVIAEMCSKAGTIKKFDFEQTYYTTAKTKAEEEAEKEAKAMEEAKTKAEEAAKAKTSNLSAETIEKIKDYQHKTNATNKTNATK